MHSPPDRTHHLHLLVLVLVLAHTDHLYRRRPHEDAEALRAVKVVHAADAAIVLADLDAILVGAVVELDADPDAGAERRLAHKPHRAQRLLAP